MSRAQIEAWTQDRVVLWDWMLVNGVLDRLRQKYPARIAPFIGEESLTTLAEIEFQTRLHSPEDLADMYVILNNKGVKGNPVIPDARLFINEDRNEILVESELMGFHIEDRRNSWGRYDWLLTELLGEMVMHGGGDDSISHEGLGPNYELLLNLSLDDIRGAAKNAGHQNLTYVEEEEFKDVKAAILEYQESGAVYSEVYKNNESAQEVWEELQDEYREPDEINDAFITVERNRYRVIHSSTDLGLFDSYEAAYNAALRHSEETDYFPHVYYTDERGWTEEAPPP